MRYLLTFLLTLTIWSGVATAATLGGLTTSGNASGNGANQLWALGPFTATEDGTATSMSVYSENANGEEFVMGIYSNHTPTRNHPEDLLRQTTAGNAGADGWQTQSLTSDLELTNGTLYWIIIHFQSPADHFYASVGADTVRYFFGDTYSSTMADPSTILAATAFSSSRLYGAVINYTPAVGEGDGWPGGVIPVTIH